MKKTLQHCNTATLQHCNTATLQHKRSKRFGILTVMLLASYIVTKAQNQNFYYTTDNQTIALSQVSGKWFVEFPDPSHQPQPTIGTPFGLSRFLVTDTTSFSSLPHFITPVYKAGSGSEMYYTRNILLQFKESTSAATKASIIAANNLTFVKFSSSFEMYRVVGDAMNVAKNVFTSGTVEYCQPDFITKLVKNATIPADEYFGKQWYLHNTGQGTNDGKSTTPNADIDAPEAWDITKGISSITVAVIDEGVTSDHPDLPNTRQVRPAGSNFAAPFDGTANPNDPSPTVSTTVGNNHGNACAGIIGASHNNIGIAGIAPNCKILPIKLDFDFSSVSDVAAAIDLAVSNNADIISNSWGYGSSDPRLLPAIITAIQNAIKSGKIVVFAAGNTADRAAGDNGFVEFPANAFIKNLICVVASDRNNQQANYSPHNLNYRTCIAAPSHTAYNGQIPGESLNIWSIDIPTQNYGYNTWRDGWSAPLPAIGETLPNTGANKYDYTGRMGGTSAAAPQVAGVLALMKSVNPCLTATQAKDLLQITANKVGGYDYNYTATADGYAPGYSQELGHGKLNAYKAVLAAQASKSDGLDLYIKDNANDIGVVGINGTGGGDKSPDIWVRNSMDGLSYQLHENPEFSSGSCYVYVRVRNKSCVTSAGNEKLSLYWSKASSWSSWPANWNGSSPSTGNKIGASQNIPVLKPGESTILTFTWTLLNPYINNSWNSCLLARIEGVVADPITVYPSRLDKDFTENNNIATRNVTIVDNYPGIRGGRVLVGNVGDVARSFNVRAQVPANNSGGTMPNITAEAEVRMTFDTQGWSILQQSGTLNQQGIQVLPNNTLLLTSPNIVLSNLNFPANTRIPVDVSFYFLCDQQTANKRYEYEVSQAFTDTPNMILGRETYEINKTVRNPFNAYAGSDVTINKGASTTLSAQQIGEAASYKWYDNAHNFVDSGASICVSPTNNKDYTLEVISLVDGFKDYDAVSVNVRQHYINSISPNPATTNTNVSYDASNTSTASLQVLLANATVYANYTLNPTQTNYSMNTSSYPAGIYTIVLYCNGTAVDSKTLQIN